MGGSWEMSHPPLPWIRVRVKVEIRFTLRFMGGRGGWVLPGKCPTHPSLRLGLESRLRLDFSLGLWEEWVGGFWEISHPPFH